MKVFGKKVKKEILWKIVMVIMMMFLIFTSMAPLFLGY